MSTAALVIAHVADTGAAAVAARLAGRLGPQSVKLLRPETLALGRWTQRIDTRGRAATRLELPDGTALASRDLRVVLNRIQWLPALRFRRASPRDRDYACAELQALVASWLAELGERVVPSARKHPWVVPPLPSLRWASAAAASGLPVAPRRMATSLRHRAAAGAWPYGQVRMDPAIGADDVATDAGDVLVAGAEARGALTARLGAGCRAAAARLGFPLLEFRFTRRGHELSLDAVDATPALTEPWAADLASAFIASRVSGRLQ